MAKKTIDLDQLHKLTEKGQQRVKRREEKKLLLVEQKHDQEAKRLADDIISDLPARMKREARGGFDSLMVCLPSGYPIHEKVGSLISSWCLENNLSVENATFYASDDVREDVLIISWPNKK